MRELYDKQSHLTNRVTNHFLADRHAALSICIQQQSCLTNSDSDNIII